MSAMRYDRDETFGASDARCFLTTSLLESDIRAVVFSRLKFLSSARSRSYSA